MSGEAAKKSGEIGEKLAQEFLNLIGWKKSLKTISINCALPDKHNAKSHGDDILYIYNNPFLEDVTEVVHISVKHKKGGYPKAQGLRTELKEHLSELNRIMACAQFSPEIRRAIESYGGRPTKAHRGLLIWVHGDGETLETDIRHDLGRIQLAEDHSAPVFLVDSGRASFVFHAIRHYESKALGEYDFYYPRLGNSISADHERFGKYLPLELIASDVLPIRATKDGKPILFLYIREKFSSYALKKGCALAQDFGDAWVEDIYIGFDDYNETQHGALRDEALLSFNNRANVSVFSYRGNLLSLLEERV